MLGVLYSAASDFSAFSYPRPQGSVDLCREIHATSIEARYCPKRHVDPSNEKDWEDLLIQIGRFVDEPSRNQVSFVAKPFTFRLEVSSPPPELPSSPRSEETESLGCASPLSFGLPSSSSTPTSPCSMSSPSLVGEGEESSSDCDSDPEFLSDFETDKMKNNRLALTVKAASNRTRSLKRGRTCKLVRPTKMLKRNDSTSSISSVSSVTSICSSASMSTAAFLQAMAGSENPWKCPHCPWVQLTQRLPDFLRHQRSHFVSQSDWPCPNSRCGKGFARKDSLKRHLDNKATGCKRPPGYTVC